jgi:hypothetical protein
MIEWAQRFQPTGARLLASSRVPLDPGSGRQLMARAQADPSATATHAAPNPFAMVLHLVKTFSLTGSVLGDSRVHPARKVAFVTAMAALIGAALGVEGITEGVTQVLNVVPGLGLALGVGEIPLDGAIDWVLVGVAAFNLLKLFPAEVVGEHYDRLFRAHG